jgi:hypothetical protein
MKRVVAVLLLIVLGACASPRPSSSLPPSLPTNTDPALLQHPAPGVRYLYSPEPASQTYWTRPHTNDATFSKDRYECLQSSIAQTQSPSSDWVDRVALLQACLGAKGYTQKTVTLPGTDAQCGWANGIGTNTQPLVLSDDLCNPGVPSLVILENRNWTWVCFGQHGGSKAYCSAPKL